jgi:5-methylcytosine-specific restriction protein A
VLTVPYKAKKPCAFPGCPKLTDGRYCEEHSKTEAKRYNRYDRDPDSGRRYSDTWKKIRAVFLAAHPLCELCQKDGRLTPAALVHHRR